MRPSPESAPLPLFGALHQSGAQGIGLDVAAQCQEVIVLRHGKTLEPPLVEVSAAAAVVVLVVAAHMRDADPAHPTSQRLVGLGSNHEVPMVGHQTVGEQFHRIALQPFRQHLLERRKIFRLMKNPHPAVPTVQNVVHHACFGGSSGSWHQGMLSGLTEAVNISDVPFLPPRAQRVRRGLPSCRPLPGP